jgi:hypothetical protein
LVKAINGYLITFVIGQDPRPMGGGVLPGDDEPDPASGSKVGIYQAVWGPLPEPPVVDPQTGAKYWHLLLRFDNGRTGMNVGLILDKFSRFPMSQDYVARYIAQEAEQHL